MGGVLELMGIPSPLPIPLRRPATAVAILYIYILYAGRPGAVRPSSRGALLPSSPGSDIHTSVDDAVWGTPALFPARPIPPLYAIGHPVFRWFGHAQRRRRLGIPLFHLARRAGALPARRAPLTDPQLGRDSAATRPGLAPPARPEFFLRDPPTPIDPCEMVNSGRPSTEFPRCVLVSLHSRT